MIGARQGSGMRHRRVWWAVLVFFWVGAQPGAASAADDIVHQRDLFAAYCVGVLDSLAARQKQAPPNRCSSLETKIACDDRAASIQQRISDTGYRRDRFERYLKIRATTLGERMAVLEAAAPSLRAMGAADLAACEDYRAAHWERFSRNCEQVCSAGTTKGDCGDCLRRQDPAVCHAVDRCEDPALLPF